MFSIVLAALALAGAPANTTVYCGMDVPMSQEGWTWFDQPTILLGPIPCEAVEYTSATPSERKKILKLNPGFKPDGVTGVGLLVLLHEAIHAAGNHDETSTECQAMRELPQLLQEAEADNPESALHSAKGWDAVLGSDYHQSPC